jgi:hypothetical protein
MQTFRNRHVQRMHTDGVYKTQREEERKTTFKEADVNSTGILNEQEWKVFNQREMQKAARLSDGLELPTVDDSMVDETWHLF